MLIFSGMNIARNRGLVHGVVPGFLLNLSGAAAGQRRGGRPVHELSARSPFYRRPLYTDADEAGLYPVSVSIILCDQLCQQEVFLVD